MNKTIPHTKRGQRRRRAGLIGADPCGDVRPALGPKFMVRRGRAAAKPLGLEGVRLRDPCQRSGSGQRVKATGMGLWKPLGGPGLLTHLSGAETGLLMSIEVLVQGAQMDEAASKGHGLGKNCPFV